MHTRSTAQTAGTFISNKTEYNVSPYCSLEALADSVSVTNRIRLIGT
jgi:hypothetical protein